MKFINALVKIGRTKDLKAEIHRQVVVVAQGSLKHPTKSHNFNLAFNYD